MGGRGFLACIVLCKGSFGVLMVIDMRASGEPDVKLNGQGKPHTHTTQ